MNDSLTLLAPAKLNLFLHITGRRSDGYHELQTLFQLLNIGDELTFSPPTHNQVTFTCSDPELVNADNLVLKAVKALEDKTGRSLSIDIHLDKSLPMGGGIGGGSSDCATTLLALNAWFRLGLTTSDLSSIARNLGADVPVFVQGKTAWAEGIGEKLTPIEIPETHYVVLHPNVHVSTAKLFGHPELTRNTPVSTIRPALAQEGHNDFEPLVRKLYADIETAFQTASAIGQPKLTGTGACLFFPVPNNAMAHSMLDTLLKSLPGLSGFVAQGVNTSPVFDQLSSFFN